MEVYPKRRYRRRLLESPEERHMAALRGVATRRARYGPSGHRPEGYDGLESHMQRQMAAQRAVATRRARYGPSGHRGGVALDDDMDYMGYGVSNKYTQGRQAYANEYGLTPINAGKILKLQNLYIKGKGKGKGFKRNYLKVKPNLSLL